MTGVFVTGLGAIKSLLGIGEKVTEEIHDQNQQAAGAAKVAAADNAQSAKVNADVAQAAVDTDAAAVAKRLRNGDF